ncbi:uncharacterized protein DDB_G0283357-like [Wyeomyia smithii]|uniref:uncharacterized protein DDB_G0283357-like n=1 Tax=Wyeomyia smithii TaxID=174621 RepID=UPI0024681C37|nr:uncharacterized protein DDB_G0283357-like [Wyeomyia smithii]
MEKVRLCRYSSVDENRFVRMQLLKGLLNREVARTARMFGYDSAFIVQSATPEEAYTSETVSVESPQAFAVAKERPSTSNRLQGKRRNESSTSGWSSSKKQRQENESRQRGFGRRSRCPKCHQLFHKFGSCPATNRNCNTCGKRGHFSAACRKKQTNNIQVKRDSEHVWTDEENDKKRGHGRHRYQRGQSGRGYGPRGRNTYNNSGRYNNNRNFNQYNNNGYRTGNNNNWRGRGNQQSYYRNQGAGQQIYYANQNQGNVQIPQQQQQIGGILPNQQIQQQNQPVRLAQIVQRQ